LGRVAVTARAVVINIHYHGATVRLEDGSLASIAAEEFVAHRPVYVAAYEKKTVLDLFVDRAGRHASARFDHGPARPGPGATAGPISTRTVPVLTNPLFEERMDEYLRATQEWAPPDKPDPAQRHFIRKKRRAAFFEARNKPT
jgi:hypothetical protein